MTRNVRATLIVVAILATVLVVLILLGHQVTDFSNGVRTVSEGD